MKKGFTLAEVLITLAVIGVVAALTIPILARKYQNQQLYTQFMKTYNTLLNAFDAAIVEYGEPNTWDWGGMNYSESNPTWSGNNDSPLYTKMKFVKKCTDATQCFASSYSDLKGENSIDGTFFTSIVNSNNKAVTLGDGSSIAVGKDSDGNYTIVMDTNGKKAPNMLGRDVFVGYYQVQDDSTRGAGMYFPAHTVTTGAYSYDNCTNTGNAGGDTNGMGCADRLLKERKMAY